MPKFFDDVKGKYSQFMENNENEKLKAALNEFLKQLEDLESKNTSWFNQLEVEGKIIIRTELIIELENFCEAVIEFSNLVPDDACRALRSMAQFLNDREVGPYNLEIELLQKKSSETKNQAYALVGGIMLAIGVIMLAAGLLLMGNMMAPGLAVGALVLAPALFVSAFGLTAIATSAVLAVKLVINKRNDQRIDSFKNSIDTLKQKIIKIENEENIILHEDDFKKSPK